MATAQERLRNARERANLSPKEVAAAIGISAPGYHDLETQNDLYDAISIAKLRNLAAALGIGTRSLFADDPREGQLEVNMQELADRLRDHLRKSKNTLSDFGDEIGWELNDFLGNPSAAEAWNLECLRDLCRALDVDWRTVL